MALSAGQVFGDYEVLAEIGRGGMGAVYQARQVSLQRIVALKVLPPHLATHEMSTTRFQTEAVAAANLNHPNIVQVFAAGEHSGVRFIAMEFVDGESVEHRIKRCGRLPLTESLDIAYHVAVALDHAWQTAKVIHRDVKPENVFLAANGTVKLGDFGLAKFLGEEASSVTATGHAMGSPHFISPEQAHGRRDIDFRADMYSLGCALHYMMTGRMVFEGPDFLSIVFKHVNEPVAPIASLLPDCPASVQRLIDRLLAKQPQDRHPSYADLINELREVRNDVAVWEASDAAERGRMRRAETPASRWIYVVAALAPLLVAGGVVYAKRGERARVVHSRVVTLHDPSDRRDFIQAVQKLPPVARVDQVIAKLREVNPGFGGKEKFTVENDVVTELSFPSVGVTNLWPVAALPHLRVLRCPGDAARRLRGGIADLTPLSGLNELEEIDCSWNPVEDLQPISMLKLKVLRCANTKVETIGALKGMQLEELDLSGTLVREVSALADMPLLHFRCHGSRVRDLVPLRGAPLEEIWCEPRLLKADLVKSWADLHTVNGVALEEYLRKVRPRRTTPGQK